MRTHYSGCQQGQLECNAIRCNGSVQSRTSCCIKTQELVQETVLSLPVGFRLSGGEWSKLVGDAAEVVLCRCSCVPIGLRWLVPRTMSGKAAACRVG
mmetsp:Transcript_991/g.1581  ORF Transcript_991/g.1581 Transcript_991/m.1581 type:complete len:97 (+) Transcript_991:123-413(+)